ncbi:MAG: Maf family protein [Bdellovibrionaceae bacterium]|nr:Maf family protein [Pseudobdellovibrionaceae bacterium]
MQQLVLASQSPRRRELLERAGFEFLVASVQISEIPNENLNLEEQIRQLAQDKAKALIESGKLPKKQGFLVLASDTVVVLDGRILGKPDSVSVNEVYLRQLSGRKHSVITSICLWDLDSGRVVLDHDVAYVTFRQLSEDEIHAYAVSGEGLDKAGGYGIQGMAGAFVANVSGSMDTIVGLPVALVERVLKENGWNVSRRKLP